MTVALKHLLHSDVIRGFELCQNASQFWLFSLFRVGIRGLVAGTRAMRQYEEHAFSGAGVAKLVCLEIFSFIALAEATLRECHCRECDILCCCLEVILFRRQVLGHQALCLVWQLVRRSMGVPKPLGSAMAMLLWSTPLRDSFQILVLWSVRIVTTSDCWAAHTWIVSPVSLLKVLSSQGSLMQQQINDENLCNYSITLTACYVGACINGHQRCGCTLQIVPDNESRIETVCDSPFALSADVSCSFRFLSLAMMLATTQ